MRYFLFSVIVASGLNSSAQSTDSLFTVSDLTPELTFTKSIEGPASGPDGRIYIVNYQRKGTIGVVDLTGNVSLFIELPQGSTGNGIRFGRNGVMFIADYTGHNILRIKPNATEVEVFAHDSTMNQPNDIALAPNGLLFASDPNWKNNTGNIWRIAPDGKTTLLESNMGTTNGIEVSPDGKVLYVNESIQRRVWRYDLDKRGNISNKKLFFQFTDFGMDGMRCDSAGNLYITRHGKGTIVVLSPKGILLREIQTKGKLPSNIAFGGRDGKTCFVTLQDRGCVEVFRNDIAGREY